MQLCFCLVSPLLLQRLFFAIFLLHQIALLFQILEICGHSGVLLDTMGSFVVHFTTIHNRGSAFSVYILTCVVVSKTPHFPPKDELS